MDHPFYAPSRGEAEGGGPQRVTLAPPTSPPLWPIPDQYRGPLINRQIAIAINPESTPQASTAAFRAILAAQEQSFLASKTSENPNWQGGPGVVQQILLEMRSDEQYIKFCLDIAERTDAGLLCQDRQPGGLENGPAPETDRQCDPGHNQPPLGESAGD